MSGPIVRKYGFPNFESIFGEREIKHGAPEEAAAPPASPSPTDPTKPAPGSEPSRTDAEPSKPR